jgi:electron transport complex protein RnfA
MNIPSLLIISVGAVFISNVILDRLLGLCPYIGVSKHINSALGMGSAMTFVMGIASAVTWVIDRGFLSPSPSNIIFRVFMRGHGTPPDLTFLRTILFLLVIAVVVQFVELAIRKISPTLYRALGIYLPLITTNCAVLGVSIINIDSNYNFLESLTNGVMSGVGFTLALILMAGLRERLEMAPIPRSMKGVPIALIMAGCMALAFLGFSGLQIGSFQ